MSHTVSRGLHRASHWLAAAYAVREMLLLKPGASVLSSGIGIGALESMERFFTWTLEGLKEPIDRNWRIPTMAPASCYTTFALVLKGLGLVYGPNMIRQQATAHLSLIKSIKAGYVLVGKPHQRDRLARFLTELIRQGESVRLANIFGRSAQTLG
ncbi:hypothetical protein KW796_02930 [Candidatus Parcubacteria bacterium]|nr:hypothetical protein [Candidatus Parcubacteria bacterium]